MVTITNSERALALVRSRLERMGRDNRSASASRGKAAATARGDRRNLRIEALARLRDLPEREFSRLLVRELLALELGEGVVADPRFLAIAERTGDLIADDAELAATLRTVRIRLADDLGG